MRTVKIMHQCINQGDIGHHHGRINHFIVAKNQPGLLFCGLFLKTYKCTIKYHIIIIELLLFSANRTGKQLTTTNFTKPTEKNALEGQVMNSLCSF